jgi:hypothetical protein
MNVPLVLCSDNNPKLVEKAIGRFVLSYDFGETLYVYDTFFNKKIKTLADEFLINGEQIIYITSLRLIPYERIYLISVNFDFEIDIDRFQGDFIDQNENFMSASSYISLKDKILFSDICKSGSAYLPERLYKKDYRRKILCNTNKIKFFIGNHNSDNSLSSMVASKVRRMSDLSYDVKQVNSPVCKHKCDAFFHFGYDKTEEVANMSHETFDILFFKFLMSSEDFNGVEISTLMKFDYIVSPNKILIDRLERMGLQCVDMQPEAIAEKIEDHNSPKIVGGLMTMNSAGFVEKTIESVLPALDRLVVVDGGSDDGTLDILRKYEKIDLIEYKWDGTYTSSRNAVLDRVREINPDWYFQIDSDEVMNKDFVNNVDYMMRNSRYNIYKFPILWLIDDDPIKYIASNYHTNIAPHRERMWRWHPSMHFEKWRVVHEYMPFPWNQNTCCEMNSVYIYHHVYILMGKEERYKKIERYDKTRKGSGSSEDSKPAYIFENYPYEIRNVNDNPLKKF